MKKNKIDNRVDITVIQKPTDVGFVCPYCGEDIEMDYEEFGDLMCTDYYGDWEFEEFCCPECGEILEVDTVTDV